MFRAEDVGVGAINSSSSDADVEAAYMDNASYQEDGSVAKARAFVTACRIILLRPRGIGHGSDRTDFAPEIIRQELAAAQDWIGSYESASVGGVSFQSVEDFRE